MKKNGLVLGLLLFSSVVLRSQTVSLAVNTLGSNEKMVGLKKEYVVIVYNDIPTHEVLFEESHFLGGEFTQKWSIFGQIYTRVYDVKTGFSNSSVEIQKPAIYNAVIKINTYLKKGLKSGSFSKDEVSQKLTHILDCANVIFFDDNVSDFENDARKAKTPEDIIQLFDSVTIKIIQQK